MKIAIHASHKLRAQKALAELKEQYATVPPEEADVIVVLGGDGSMLRALHEFNDYQAPIFGMNLGTLGFLLNDYRIVDLEKRIDKAESFKIHPLRMEVIDKNGKIHKKLAYNEVSIIRETHASAKLKVHVDGKVRISEMVCDGVLVATPVGSTAYNSSAGGPILPLDSNVMPITPISSFRPRNWPGALINQNCDIKFDVIKPVERPVSATADAFEIRDVRSVTIHRAQKVSKTLMFDPDNALKERIFKEQFAGERC